MENGSHMNQSGRRTTSLRPAPLRTVLASHKAHGSSKPLGISAYSFRTMYLLVTVKVNECRVFAHVLASLALRLQVMGV